MLANVDHCTERNSKVASGLSAHNQPQRLTLAAKLLAKLLAFPGHNVTCHTDLCEDTSPDYCTVLHVIYRVI